MGPVGIISDASFQESAQMGGKRKTESGKPKPTRATQRDGALSNLLYDWFEIPFAAGVLLERRNLAWETHYNTCADEKFRALEGHTANEVTMLIAHRAKLKIHYGKLTDGKPYWFGNLNDHASVIRVFAADQAIECVKELLLLAEGMQGCVNSSPYSPDVFYTEPEWDAFMAQLNAEYGG
jgi:hypothetical protein